MRWHSAWSSAAIAALALGLGCGTAQPDCGCVVQKGAERRSLACGQSACVAGSLENCSETGQIVERGACNNAPPSMDETDAGTATGSPSNTPDHSCDDLLSYCNSSCHSPTSASTDCQNTASSGDSAACQQWQQTNGVLCRP
jgi:hypothetical protein